MKLLVAQSTLSTACGARVCTSARFFFCVEARALAPRERHGPHRRTPQTSRPLSPLPPTGTASPAKRRAPTRRRQLASPCRPLRVDFQAASCGRRPKGSPDPGGRERGRPRSRGPTATTVDRVPRSSLHTRAHEDARADRAAAPPQ